MHTTSAAWLTNFISVYQQLDKHCLHQLDAIYHPEIHFQDPLHNIHGLASLKHYFSQLYQNLDSCQFLIQHSFSQQSEVALYWEMQFIHPKLNRGATIHVSGHSHLRAEQQQVIYHRDYLDAGAMLYEQIPLLRNAIGLIKRRVQ